MDVEDTWSEIKNVCILVADNKLKPEKIIKKQQWMTEEILDLMEDR